MRHVTAVHHPPYTHARVAMRPWQFVADRFLLLPIGAALALVWANMAGESYFRFAHAAAFAVNEIAMALFLALLAQEGLESLMPGGALHTWRRWTVPLIGAGGGLAGAALVYIGFVQWRHELVLVSAWPVAGVIDIAAGYYVLRAVWPRGPAAPFLLMLAAATNAVGMFFVALGPSAARIAPGGAVLIVVAVVAAVAMKRLKVRAFTAYLCFCGAISWAGFYWAGFHPALALVPIVPFLPREARLNPFATPKDDDAVHHAERLWTNGVQLILFGFGLVNAGVLLGAYDTGTWAVLAAALVGRPLGILAAVALAVAVGLHLPKDIGVRALVVIAVATSSGFTFALLLATGLLPVGAVLSQIKMGALATVAGAAAAIVLARLMRVGRFAPSAER